MKNWQASIKKTLTEGKHSGDRTGTGVVRRFGDMLRFNLLEGFPLVTCKKTNFKGIKEELLWFLRGEGNIRSLIASGCHIWDEWVIPETAEIEPVSAKEIIKLSSKLPNWNLDLTLDILEEDFFASIAKHPLYVSSTCEGFNSDTHVEVMVARPTGDEIVDKMNQLEGIITFLLSYGIDREELVSVAGLYSSKDYLPWMKKIANVHCPEQLWPVKVVGGDVGPLYPVQWRNAPVLRTPRYMKKSFENFVEQGGSYESTEDFIAAYTEYLQYLEVISEGHDQIAKVVQQLRTDPTSRRILVMAWNVSQLNEMALPPCHFGFQLFSEELTICEREQVALTTDEKFEMDWASECSIASQEPLMRLNLTQFMDDRGVPKRGLRLMFFQRSQDSGLGSAFNIASYALLCHMLAQVTDHAALEVIQVIGDAHVYDNHIEAMTQVVEAPTYKLPRLKLNPMIKEIDDFESSDIELIGYESGPFVPLEVAV